MGIQLNLLAAVRFHPGSRIALTGAGGKSSALFALGREYFDLARSVNKTTPLDAPSHLPELAVLAGTTHLHILQAQLADRHFVLPDDLLVMGQLIQNRGLVLLSGPQGDEQRLKGLPLGLLSGLLPLNLDRGMPIFIEADGSRRLSLKAPANHEPVVPNWVDTVVVAAGLSGLYRPLTSDWVFRPEIFAQLAGQAQGDLIQPEHIARVLAHPQGGLKGLPDGVRRVALLNQAGTPRLRSAALRIADHLLTVYDAVITADLPSAEETAQASHAHEIFAVHERIAAVILAAGAAIRYGRVKQLLDWQGEPLVRRAARIALAAGLSPVIVVTGCASDRVGAAVAGLPVQEICNLDWESGQASSVNAGLQALPPNVGGAIFMLADQPFVPVTLLRKLVELHACTLAPIIAPLADDRRSNPVLFDRATFPDFHRLSGDAGGRTLFSRYPVQMAALAGRTPAAGY